MPWEDNLTRVTCSACDASSVVKNREAALSNGWVEKRRAFDDGGVDIFQFCPNHAKAANQFFDKQDQDFEVWMKSLKGGR